MRPVLVALRVLEAISASQPAHVSELARRLQEPKSTVQRNLQSLAAGGWIQPWSGEGSGWVLTSRAWRVGRAAPAAVDLCEAADEPVRRLRDRAGETVHLASFTLDPDAPAGAELVVVRRYDGPQPVRTVVAVGTPPPLHASGCGRAVLAALPPQRVDALLSRPLHMYSAATPGTAAAVRADLERVRARGWAVNDGQWRPGVAAVAAAVVAAGRPIGAVAVSYPQQRFTPDVAARTGPLVAEAAALVAAGYAAAAAALARP